MGLFKIIIGVIVGSILLIFINFTGLFDFIADEAIHGLLIIFVVGFVAGLGTGSPLGGAVAGAIAAFLVPTVNYIRHLEEIAYTSTQAKDLYMEWLRNTQLKLLIVALIGGFVGGFLMARRSQQTTLRLRY